MVLNFSENVYAVININNDLYSTINVSSYSVCCFGRHNDAVIILLQFCFVSRVAHPSPSMFEPVSHIMTQCYFIVGQTFTLPDQC